MTSSEALKALEEGKKIRKSYWDKGYYVYVGEKNKLFNNSGKPFGVFELADYWRIYEDDKKADARFAISDEEREIISNCISAFKKNMCVVQKEADWLDFYDDCDHVVLSIDFASNGLELLGMEDGREYTLEELKL